MYSKKKKKSNTSIKGNLHLTPNLNVIDKANVLASFHGLNLSDDYARLINTNFRYTFLGFTIDQVRSMVSNLKKHDEDYSKFVNYFHHLYSLKGFYDRNETEYIDLTIRILHSIYSDDEVKEYGLPTVLDIYNLSESSKPKETPISQEEWDSLIDSLYSGREA